MIETIVSFLNPKNYLFNSVKWKWTKSYNFFDQANNLALHEDPNDTSCVKIAHFYQTVVSDRILSKIIR